MAETPHPFDSDEKVLAVKFKRKKEIRKLRNKHTVPRGFSLARRFLWGAGISVVPGPCQNPPDLWGRGEEQLGRCEEMDHSPVAQY